MRSVISRGVWLLSLLLFGPACGVRFGPGRSPTDASPSDASKDASIDAAGKPDATVSPDAELDATDPCEESDHIFTETAEFFVVPEDVKYMVVKAWGSGANSEEQCNATGQGGPGGYTAAVFDVSESAELVVPGCTLSIVVGRRVHLNETEEEVALHGFAASGGGGLSGVFLGGFPLTSAEDERALLIAGGGGSAGSVSESNCSIGRPGNHPEVSEMGDMQGGEGDHDDLNGGGGGYRGGEGGPWGGAAWGGTEFVPQHSDVLDFRIEHQPEGIWTAPMAGDPDHDGTAGEAQARGLVVIHFVCEPPPPL